VFNETELREKTIGNLSFETKEKKDRLESQFLGFRKLKDVLIVVSLVLLFLIIWCVAFK